MPAKPKPVLEWWVDNIVKNGLWSWETMMCDGADGYKRKSDAKRAGARWLKRYCSGCELVFVESVKRW